MRQLEGSINERLDGVKNDLKKSNTKYALALERTTELRLKINPIFMSKRDIMLGECDREDFQEYYEQTALVRSVEQQYFYKRGFADCVQLLRELNIVR